MKAATLERKACSTQRRDQRVLKKKWESKVMHGRNIRSMDRQLVGGEDTSWQSRGELKGETGSEISAAQDLALQNKNHATKILLTYLLHGAESFLRS